MSILRVAAMAGLNNPALDAITADWADIAVASPSLTDTNANVAITFTSGGTRTFMVTYSSVGRLRYRINSGTYTDAPTGTTFSVSTTDTVNFRYTNDEDINEARNVTVTDVTRGSIIDTFSVSYTGGSLSA